MRLQANALTRHAHRLVGHVAEEMAQAVYEECARDNGWYAEHRDRRAFVREVAPKLIPQARQTLGEMLARPGVDDATKEAIMDALSRDATMLRGGKSISLS